MYASPNFLGFFLFPGLLLAYVHFQKTQVPRERWLHLGIGFAVLGALYLTHSYAAWLAAGVSVSLFLWMAERKNNRKLFCGFGVIVLICLGLVFLEGRNSEKLTALLSFGERSSLSSRVMIWQSASLMLHQEPVLGIGVGNFQREYLAQQRYFPPYLEWAVPEPHNLFLAVWLQMGMWGLLGLLGLIGIALRNGWRQQKKPAVRILLSLFLGLLAYGLVDTPLFGNALAFVFWMNLFALIFVRD
jgi:O-antigen ligase